MITAAFCSRTALSTETYYPTPTLASLSTVAAQYSHGRTSLLALQIDAAINSGNSGGPVLKGDRWLHFACMLPPQIMASHAVHAPAASVLPCFPCSNSFLEGPIIMVHFFPVHRVIGIAFQCLTSGESIGYVIPVPGELTPVNDDALTDCSQVKILGSADCVNICILIRPCCVQSSATSWRTWSATGASE